MKLREYLNEVKKLKIAKSYWDKLTPKEKNIFEKLFYGSKYSDIQTIKSFLSAIKKDFDINKIEIIKLGVIQSNNIKYDYSFDNKKWIKLK